MKQFRFVLYVLLFCHTAVGQKRIAVNVEFPPGINAKKLIVYFNNGRQNVLVSPTVNGNKLTVSEPYYYRYGALLFSYPGKAGSWYYNNFFFTDKPAKLRFRAVGDTDRSPLNNYRLVNGRDFKNDTRRFSTLISAMTRATTEELLAKEIQLIEGNRASYYSFWFFNSLALNSQVNPDSLLHVLGRFRDDFRNSQEAAYVKENLYGRKSIRKGNKAPDFSCKDINGKEITLNAYSNRKYVLLLFWATWCVPCMQEMPAVRSIRDDYKNKGLEIIALSFDSDYGKFLKVIGEQGMDWINIYNDKNFVNSYGGYVPIPQAYLIDKSKTIIYSKEEDGDADLSRLRQVLTRELSNN